MVVRDDLSELSSTRGGGGLVSSYIRTGSLRRLDTEGASSDYMKTDVLLQSGTVWL